MAIKIISNKFSKKEGAQTQTPDGDSTKKEGKKFNPRWGKPVIVRCPAKAKKPQPAITSYVTPPSPPKKEEETAKVDVIVPEVDRPALANFSATESNLHATNVESVPANAPFPEPQVHPVPSFSKPDYSNIIQHLEAKESKSRKRVGIAVAAVILICIALGYIYFPKPKSEQVAEHAVPSFPQEAVVTAPAVAVKPAAPVAVPQKDPKMVREEEIKKFIDQWLAGWQSGDIKTYGACYATDFESKGKNLDAWIAYKTNVFKKSKNIRVTIDDLRISSDENGARAVFTQHYSSAINKDAGRKTLELKKINNEWKIYREIM